MSLVLGVDVGSQSIKAVLVDEGGDVVATGSAALSMTHEHDGWAEQDPQTYCTALRDAVRAATAGIEPTRVVAMGLGSQVDGVVACDADGEPLRPAIIWLDKRATEQCDRLVAAVGEDMLAERTGLVADASHSAPKMMWIRDHEPPVWQHTATLAPVGSYLLHHLTGSHAQDAANASSTMVYDVTRGDFDESSCTAAELDPSMFAPVRPSTDVVGTLLPDVASEFGLPASCAVVVGTGDEHAASVGAGAIEAGVVVDVTGTAEPVTTVSEAPVRDPLGLVETHGHAVPGSWLIENPGFVSGGSTLWLAGLLGVPQAEVFPLALSGATGQRRRAVPAGTVGGDGAAVERPDAWRPARPRDEPHAGPRRTGGARRLCICVARHRRTTRRARPRSRRGADRRWRRARQPVGDDQGQCARETGAPRADRGGHCRRRRHGRRGGHRVLRGLHRGIRCRPARSGRHRPRPRGDQDLRGRLPPLSRRVRRRRIRVGAIAGLSARPTSDSRRPT